MKKLIFTSFLAFSVHSFAQMPTVMPRPEPQNLIDSDVATQDSLKQKIIIRGVDFSNSHDGEISLAMAMDKMTDEELLEFIRKYLLIDGKLPPKKD